MDWRDDGVLLAVRPHGERDAILDILTAAHGRHLGLCRGGASAKRAAELQPGAQLSVSWRARLASQLGVFRAEAVSMRAGRLLDDKRALAALSAVAALASLFLPERAPHPAFYAETRRVLDALTDPETWPGLYAAWELRLLEEIGVGLDLSACAATGVTQELIWVSPRSGRAVSRSAGAPYADRLLPLPSFLRLGGPATEVEFAQALRLSGHFLRKWAAPSIDRELPAARERLALLAGAG